MNSGEAVPDPVLFVFGMNTGAMFWVFSLAIFHGTGLHFVLSLIMG